MQHTIANAAEPSSNVISLGFFSIDSAILTILVKLGSSQENALLVSLILVELGPPKENALSRGSSKGSTLLVSSTVLLFILEMACDSIERELSLGVCTSDLDLDLFS